MFACYKKSCGAPLPVKTLSVSSCPLQSNKSYLKATNVQLLYEVAQCVWKKLWHVYELSVQVTSEILFTWQ